MSLLVALIIGGLIGYAAAAMLGRREGIIASVIIGIVGSFIGSVISMLFTGGDRAALSLSWSSVLWSFLGAVILVAIMNAIQRPHHNNPTRL